MGTRARCNEWYRVARRSAQGVLVSQVLAYVRLVEGDHALRLELAAVRGRLGGGAWRGGGLGLRVGPRVRAGVRVRVRVRVNSAMAGGTCAMFSMPTTTAQLTRTLTL